MREVYQRKLRYWPMVVREFRALELPEVLGYVAWTESRSARWPATPRGRGACGK
jgi:hypothetical protein